MKKIVIVTFSVLVVLINLLILTFNILVVQDYGVLKNIKEIHWTKYAVYEDGFQLAGEREYVPESWLKIKYSFEEFKDIYHMTDESFYDFRHYIAADLYHFYRTLEPADEVWEYWSGDYEEELYIYRRGYAIVRDDSIIGGMVTRDWAD